MKTIFSLILFCALWISALAQVPHKMSYQAVIRDAGGELVSERQVGLRITILEGSLPGTVVYQEVQTPYTNSNGLVTVEIGGGAGFDTIAWGNGIHHIKTEIDPSGGTDYTITGTSQLLSVPYALYAGDVQNKELDLPYTGTTNTFGAGFQITNSSTTDSSSGLSGISSSITGKTFGIGGSSASTSGYGVMGTALATAGMTHGVFGKSYSDQGDGVFGWAGANTGSTRGVWGQAESTSGNGVYGCAVATSGFTMGVYGWSKSPNGKGVAGKAEATSGATYGVHGWAMSPDGVGVYGQAPVNGILGKASNSTGVVYGVRGETMSDAGIAVLGFSRATGGAATGVYGHTYSPEGNGVFGIATTTTGENYGVQGISTSPEGYGVFGRSEADSGYVYGVFGQNLSKNGGGVLAVAGSSTGNTNGVWGESRSTTGKGVFGQASATSGVNYGVYGNTESSDGYAVYGHGLKHGVYGNANASSGDAYGVYGTTTSLTGYGVYGNSFSNGVKGNATATTGEAYGVRGETASDAGTGVYAIAHSTTGNTFGVRSIALANNGTGVLGMAGKYGVYGIGEYGVAGFTALTTGTGVSGMVNATTGINYGIYGTSASNSGYGVYGKAPVTGVYGQAHLASGTAFAIRGDVISPTGFSGYFTGGRFYISGNTGIGMDNPGAKLEVNGQVKITGGTPGTGKVLTCDAAGLAHWQAPGFWLPYLVNTSSSGPSFSITNSGTGTPVSGISTYTGEEELIYGVYGETAAADGAGIYGFAKSMTGYVPGVFGKSHASDGYGVLGKIAVTTGNGIGVYGESPAINGTGVKGEASHISGTTIGVKGVVSSPNGYSGHFTGGKFYVSGNVGIGIESPAAKLEVDGFVKISNTGTGNGLLAISNSTTGLTSGVVGESHSTSGTGVLGTSWATTGTTYGIKGKTYSGTGYSGYFEGGRFYVDGNVGIGTNAPIEKLVVNGNLLFPEGNNRYILFPDNIRSLFIGGKPGIESSYAMFFVTDNGSGVGVERLTIKSDKVGIGTVSPSQVLDVNGNARFRSIASTAYSNVLNIQSDGTLTTATSDGRLKENVCTLQNSLEKVMLLRGVSFTWKKNPEYGTRIGFIAQEFEKVIPELVFTNQTDGYKGINYAEVSAVLVEAVKELKAENDRLKTENERINARLDKIDKILGENVMLNNKE